MTHKNRGVSHYCPATFDIFLNLMVLFFKSVKNSFLARKILLNFQQIENHYEPTCIKIVLFSEKAENEAW